MSRLSKFLRFSPRIFYVAAIIVLFASFALPLHEYSRLGYSTQIPSDELGLKVTLIRYILNEVLNALYLLANGLLLEVLIAIWDRLRPVAAGAAE